MINDDIFTCNKPLNLDKLFDHSETKNEIQSEENLNMISPELF